MAETSRVNLKRKTGLILAFFGFIIFLVVIGYVAKHYVAHYIIPLDISTWVVALIIFGIMVVINTSMLPLPFGVSIMLIASLHWNPILMALFGSLGASIGESLSYFLGLLGKGIFINEKKAFYKRIHEWVKKYGIWGIALLSFQPILPFEIAGFIAGLLKMSFPRFLLATWIGKFPKYIIIVYLGIVIMQFFY
jgi:uncharacterized membrane protein YdjX (TVP38/TMEM64 family)